MNRLLARLDVLTASCTAPSTLDTDLRDFVELKLEARAGRAEHAVEMSRARSDLNRGRVRAALGAAPLGKPMAELVKVAQKRLQAKCQDVGEWTIRDEIRVMRRESGSCGGRRTETTSRMCQGATSKSS